MFSVYYSDEEHDNLLTDTPSLFEATCEFYGFINSDLNEGEYITIRDDNENIIRSFSWLLILPNSFTLGLQT